MGKITTFEMPEEDTRILSVAAAIKGISRSEMIRLALSQYKERNPDLFFAAREQIVAHSEQSSLRDAN